jgi:phosphatidylethanolamine-binding protein (PEBP) family uncharacterized protein
MDRPGEPDSAVYERAKERGQETFTLVAQDLSAPATIIHWIEINIGNEVTPDEKLREAFERALKMRRFALEVESKYPD